MNYQNYLSNHSNISNIWKWKDVIKITESSTTHYIKSALVKVQILNIFLKKPTISINDQYVSLGCNKNVEHLDDKN